VVINLRVLQNECTVHLSHYQLPKKNYAP
jgi:hypothetical protein